ncbi:hypothetical protein ACHK7U_08685, partial [Staphylococcus hominis]|uniref:hypothetical protein n=1 Tax=Staphylococcus hominis TaxID=1290 RepID=UPI0039BFE681
IGKELFRKLFDQDIDLNNVGQRILTYHYPSFDQAGGPVSHYDLYFYHYFPLGINFILIFLLGIFLVSIANNRNLAIGNLFLASLISTLWIRGLVMLLDPAMGFTYIIDFL